MCNRLAFIFLFFSLIFFSCKKDNPGNTTPAEVELPFPEWVFYHWVWEGESHTESAKQLADDYLAHDIPVGAIIIDSPWETGYNTLEWDTARFPGAQSMIDYFHSKNIRTLLWITGMVNTDVQPLFDSLKTLDYFMKQRAGSQSTVIEWWKGDGGLIDWYNPEAVNWWKQRMDNILDMGIDGWKCDGTDYYAIAAPYSPGAGKNIARLDYSAAYYRLFYDYSREKLGKDRVIMSRPIDNYGLGVGGDLVAFTPVDIGFACWVGDQDGTFSGMTKALDNMYLSSDYGYLVVGSDIGGYRNDDLYPATGRSKELFIRWAQLGAFCPFMENGGGGEHRPWEFDDETTDIYRKFVNLHMQLVPYFVSTSKEKYPKKKPIMDFVRKADYSYLLGNDIFVTPLKKAGSDPINISFPAGSNWVYLFDKSKKYSGGSTEALSFTLDEFPVFIKEGSDLVDNLIP